MVIILLPHPIWGGSTMRIARKNLFAEKTRFAISVGGVAFAVFLILVLGSSYQGWMMKLAAYVGA